MIHPHTMAPVWDTDTVWEESIMFMKDSCGIAEATFLYPPLEILKVTSTDGATTFEEGVDWVLTDGKLRLTENTRIYTYTYDELYPREKPASGGSFPMNDRFLLFGEDRTFIKNQISVTYTCRRGGWDGPVPQLADKELPRSFELLRGGKPMTVLFYGDSITTGCNSSKMVNVPPYAPCWYEMVIDIMKKHFGNPNIRYVNTAVGGKNSEWALEQLQERS